MCFRTRDRTSSGQKAALIPASHGSLGAMKHRIMNFVGYSLLVMGVTGPGCGSGMPGADPTADNQGSQTPQTPPGQPPDTMPGGTVSPDAAILGGCQVFPADNPWNRDVSKDPVDPNSAVYMNSMNGGTRFLHPDFG